MEYTTEVFCPDFCPIMEIERPITETFAPIHVPKYNLGESSTEPFSPDFCPTV